MSNFIKFFFLTALLAGVCAHDANADKKTVCSITVNSPDAKTNFRNLLDGRVARRWMEEAAVALRNLSPSMVGATAQDGGVAVEIPLEQIERAQKELFLA